MTLMYNKITTKLSIKESSSGRTYHTTVYAQDSLGNIVGHYDFDESDSRQKACDSLDLSKAIDHFQEEGIVDGRKRT